MKTLLCFLTGGHRYSPWRLITERHGLGLVTDAGERFCSCCRRRDYVRLPFISIK